MGQPWPEPMMCRLTNSTLPTSESSSKRPVAQRWCGPARAHPAPPSVHSLIAALASLGREEEGKETKRTRGSVVANESVGTGRAGLGGDGVDLALRNRGLDGAVDDENLRGPLERDIKRHPLHPVLSLPRSSSRINIEVEEREKRKKARTVGWLRIHWHLEMVIRREKGRKRREPLKPSIETLRTNESVK